MEAAITTEDAVITAYRAHGWSYIRGISVLGVLAELTGMRQINSYHIVVRVKWHIITYHLSFLSSDWSIDRVIFTTITCHITRQEPARTVLHRELSNSNFSKNYVIK